MLRICRLMVFFFILLLPTLGFSQEKKLINEILVVMDDNYPPYVMRDSKGNLTGILPELWRIFEEETGIHVILVGTDWAEALRIINEEQADVIDTIFKIPERELIYDFSEPYAAIPVSIFHHESLSGITEPSNIVDFTIAAKAGDACIEMLKRHGVSTFRLYPSYETIIKDATEGNVKIFCMDDPPAFYYLEKYGIADNFRKGFTLYTGQFHRAVKKGRLVLLKEVENGFASISQEKINAVYDKWMGHEISRLPRYLEYIGPISFFILLLIVFVGLWNLVLHRAVRKRTEELKDSLEAIREREQLLLVTLESLEDGVIVVNNQGCISKMNKASERLIGCREEEVTGKHLQEVLNVTSGEINRNFSIKENLEKVILERRSLHFKDALLLISSSGQPYYVEITISPIHDEYNHSYGAVVVIRDVTEELKKSRELEITRNMFELAIEGAGIGVGTLYVPQTTIYKNKIWNQIMGFGLEDSQETFENWLSLVHPDHRDKVKEAITLCLSGDAEFFDEEYLIKHRDGHWIWVHSRGKVIERGKDGSPIWYAGVILDITERKLAEEKLKKLEKELSRISRLDSLGRLAGGIAHDFNNILMVILGYGEMALKDIEEKHPARNKVEQMIASAEKATQLTRKLLTFSRKQPSHPEILNLNHLLRDFEKVLSRVVSEDIELVMKLPDDPLYVFIDPAEIEQVIMNLAINARDAMPKGGKLLIEVCPVELDETYTEAHPDIKPGRYIVLSITDTGEGIDPEVIDHIFEPFFSTKPDGKGTGLGLAIVYGIVKQAGGGIHVYSEPGKGSTFKIYLPASHEIRPGTKTGEIKSEVTFLGEGEHILVVEDNNELRKLITDYLRNLGYTVTSAKNGKEALLVIESGVKPDLVITDLVMPEMNGGSFVLEMRRRFGTDIEVIYMSGYPKEVISKYDTFDTDETLLMKPFRIDDLLREVRKKLNKAKKHRNFS